MTQLPLDTSCSATYQDGFVLDETDLNDANPYGAGNTFRAILEKSAEAEHGRLVLFSVFYMNNRYDVDWKTLPDNARPIRFRDGFVTLHPNGDETRGWSGCRFGYQYNDETGKNIQEVHDL
jgi:hypothetical protein